jgi:hypothetical protein
MFWDALGLAKPGGKQQHGGSAQKAAGLEHVWFFLDAPFGSDGRLPPLPWALLITTQFQGF